MKRILSLLLVLQTLLSGETIELLDLDIISYELFTHNDPATIKQLQTALLEKGIVGIKGVPGYKERVEAYIDAARHFSAFPEETKEKYAPNREAGDLFIGYEKGKEKFKTEDGKWVVDDQKVSYYAFVTDTTVNKWPEELELKTPYEALGMLMSDTAEAVMQKINLIGPTTLDGIPRVGRMLYYLNSTSVLTKDARYPMVPPAATDAGQKSPSNAILLNKRSQSAITYKI